MCDDQGMGNHAYGSSKSQMLGTGVKGQKQSQDPGVKAGVTTTVSSKQGWNQTGIRLEQGWE